MVPICVLLVSPNPAFLHAARQALGGHECIGEVLTAYTVPQARALVRSRAPAVVFLDAWLPGTNTAQVVGELKAQSWTPRVALMSMDDSALYRNAVMALGADGVIDKCKFTAEARAFCAAVTQR
jgi:DNA-binding NarL/FixJ family response regulator